MNPILRTTLACAVLAIISIAAAPKAAPRLTPKRLAELTAPVAGVFSRECQIEITGIGRVTLPTTKSEGKIEVIREFRYPTRFEPPHAVADAPAITPTTPTEFERIDAGWTVQLETEPLGKLIAIQGVAEFTDVQLVPASYGAIAGPVYTEKGELITPNKLVQPKIQSTTTRFHLYAIPGESYDVIFYRGTKEEKHKVTVTHP